MSRFSASAYPTGSPTRTCSKSGRALVVGERYVATLVERADEQGRPTLKRADFGESEWVAGARPESPARLVGFWRCTVHDQGSRPKPVLDDAAMLELLEQIEPGDTRRDGLRYVLALMLVRRRLLIAEPAKGDVLALRRRGEVAETAQRIEVKDPGLDEAALGELVAELEALAGGDGPETDGRGS